jgi:hypothetical protein
MPGDFPDSAVGLGSNEIRPLRKAMGVSRRFAAGRVLRCKSSEPLVPPGFSAHSRSPARRAAPAGFPLRPLTQCTRISIGRSR